MRVLGIDPGSRATGFGVVERVRGRLRYLHAGVIRTQTDAPMSVRLHQIHEGLVEALGTFQPREVAIEAIFRHKSSESALRLGQARGVALLAAAQAGFDPTPYNPMTVKRTVGASGGADKVAVARMVNMLLGIDLKLASDASDALAIAITHLAHRRSALR